MINYWVKKAYSICRKNESIPYNNKKLWQKIYYNGIKLVLMALIEITLIIQYRIFKKAIFPLIDDGTNPIVSLTSFPARINTLWIVIYSIYKQTNPPSKIILVLTKEEFSDALNSIPKSLKIYLNKGLEIVFTEYNLRPHNKYFYALNKYKNRNIITIDDDLYYWPDTLERLVKLNLKFPNSICANTIQTISFQNDTLILSKNFSNENVKKSNIALGVNGVLYPPNFRSEELFNSEKIKSLCLNADDLWLKAQELLINIDVISGNRYTVPMFVIGSQKFALRFSNVNKNENEMQWKKLNSHYNLSDYLN